MDTRITDLKHRLAEVEDLKAASSLLTWDQATYMPPGGAAARARQGATLGAVIHERATDAALGRLLDDLAGKSETLDPLDADLVRVAREDFQRAVRVPDAYVRRFAAHAAHTYEVWGKARDAADFSTIAGDLARTVEMSREYASFFPDFAHPADALIDLEDPGVTVAQLVPLFEALRKDLVPLVRAIAGKPVADDGFLTGTFSTRRQLRFGRRVVKAFRYDLARGREDLTRHPFTIGLSVGDVRITTRARADDPRDALFSTLHEAGHGMYEQGIDPALDGTPLASGASSGLHESQSRLWENQVGRSRVFWQKFYPAFQKAFPAALGDVDADAFHRAVNKVVPSLIRTDADEVTYNLHVMLRFDLELALLDGRLAAADLPDAWAARMEADLGVTPPNDAEGALQDVHWYFGHVGGQFQGYALGNLYAAQLFAAARRARPEIDAQMAKGRFDALRAWLGEHVWVHGRRRTADRIVEAATGAPLAPGPFLDYLRDKYGALYGLTG
jgi:carboxypeptidase Taq